MYKNDFQTFILNVLKSRKVGFWWESVNHKLNAFIKMLFLYLNCQYFFCLGSRLTCFLDQVFPRLLPIHTSNPASASRKPRLVLGRFVTQLLPAARRPCWRNTTGLASEIWIKRPKNVTSMDVNWIKYTHIYI